MFVCRVHSFKVLVFSCFPISTNRAIMSSNNASSDPRRPDKIVRYKPSQTGSLSEDPTPDYMNVLSMMLSMFGLTMKIKWCAWFAIFASSISFSNSRVNDDNKQIFSSFMLSISSVVMTYMQNPLPMQLPFINEAAQADSGAS